MPLTTGSQADARNDDARSRMRCHLRGLMLSGDHADDGSMRARALVQGTGPIPRYSDGP